MRTRRAAAFTLLETTLALVVGIVATVWAVTTANSYMAHAKISQGKTNLAAIRQNLLAYKYRNGSWPVFRTPPATGYGKVSAVAAAASTTVTLTTAAYLQVGDLVVFMRGTGPTYTYLDNSVKPILDTSSKAVTGVITGIAGSTLTLQAGITAALAVNDFCVPAGLVANIDDLGNQFVPGKIPNELAATNPPVRGLGLADAYIGLYDVRPFDDVGGVAPTPLTTWLMPAYATPGTSLPGGFVYNKPGISGGTEKWVGLAYNQQTGEVQYVLPMPNTAYVITPDPGVGKFDGDPPINWGR